jgi:hypothetical protein
LLLLLLHADCYDCVDKCITIGGKANFCPVCNLLLGPNPYEHNKLKYDFTLDSLVRKVRGRREWSCYEQAGASSRHACSSSVDGQHTLL